MKHWYTSNAGSSGHAGGHVRDVGVHRSSALFVVAVASCLPSFPHRYILPCTSIEA